MFFTTADQNLTMFMAVGLQESSVETDFNSVSQILFTPGQGPYRLYQQHKGVNHLIKVTVVQRIVQCSQILVIIFCDCSGMGAHVEPGQCRGA